MMEKAPLDGVLAYLAVFHGEASVLRDTKRGGALGNLIARSVCMDGHFILQQDHFEMAGKLQVIAP
jgi:urea transporter